MGCIPSLCLVLISCNWLEQLQKHAWLVEMTYGSDGEIQIIFWTSCATQTQLDAAWAGICCSLSSTTSHWKVLHFNAALFWRFSFSLSDVKHMALLRRTLPAAGDIAPITILLDVPPLLFPYVSYLCTVCTSELEIFSRVADNISFPRIIDKLLSNHTRVETNVPQHRLNRLFPDEVNPRRI